MRKLTTLLLSLFLTSVVFGTSVTQDQARQVADNYCSHYSGMSNLKLKDSFSHSYNGITTFFVFNYEAGGFALVAADDAITPVLAESNTGYFDSNISVPAVKYWIDNYDKDIAHIIAARYDNTITLKEWNNIMQNDNPHSLNDVGPLTATTWDQGCYYNAQCPAASMPSNCNHVYTGCVATTMSQLEKYWAFPAQGYLSHSYVHPTYGQQSANFGTTSYNWSAMPNSVISANANVASIMYQNGVAVNMNYGTSSSGAFNTDVPWAMVTYFNYDPSSIAIKDKSNYTATGWSNMLKAELDLIHPIYYSGDDGTDGHAWVCDGYNSAGKFHMNWGWSGMYNGYYTIGSLNAGGYTPNQNNEVIIGIKPGNPNLVVRFTNLMNNQMIGYGSQYEISASVLTGTATTINLLLDGNQIYTTSGGTFTFPWNTIQYAEGEHMLRVQALNATDTVYHEVKVSTSQWIPEASGFATAARGVGYICAVDTLVAWATAYDGSGGGATINEFTKTVNGGDTWTPGQVLGGSTYGIGNICGLDGNIAYVDIYNGGPTQDNTCGVYKTSDGGSTWTHLVGATQGSASFADNVWFWNENEGMCHGDVRDNYFEIYWTSNGGTTWTRVPKTNIGGGANPASGEGGWTSVIQAVGDSTIMFGSNKSKLYISYDRGHNWIISNSGITPATNGGINKIAFKDNMNGLVAQTVAPVVIKETHNGGSTWQTVTPVGTFPTSDFTYVKGTDNTYVGAAADTAIMGTYYSFDGGHSWDMFVGTHIDQFLSVSFVNNHCGWSGSFNVDATTGGMYKYIGFLDPSSVLAKISGLTAQVQNNAVNLSWNPPALKTMHGYNVYRNDTLLTPTPITQVYYHDAPVANGKQTYCVTAVYDNGESEAVCVDAYITVGIPNSDPAAFTVYPNPAGSVVNLITPSPFDQVRIFTMQGQEVYNYTGTGNNLRILTDGFKPGMYVMQVRSEEKVITKKFSVK